MALDIGKMKRGYQREQRGGEFLTLAQGETLLYIHPQCRPDDKWEPTDGVNYIPTVVHYGIGKGKGSMVTSLDPELNPIIEHPLIKRLLKASNKRLTGKCPTKELLESGDLDDDEMNDSRASSRYAWGVTVIATREDSSEEWRNVNPKPSVLMAGKTVFDGIMEVFFDNGDITDPKAAILVIIKRTGKDMTTKYAVKTDPESLKKPKKLNKELRAALVKALKEGGDCDLFKIVSNMIKSPTEVEALISGVKVEEDPDEKVEEEEDETPDDGEDDGEGDLDKTDEEEEDDPPAEEEDEDAPPADDDDDDDEPPAEEEDEDAPPADDDDPPAEEEEDEDAKELAALMAKQKAKKAKKLKEEKAAAKKKAKADKDKTSTGDDMGLDEIDAELARIQAKKAKAEKAKAK